MNTTTNTRNANNFVANTGFGGWTAVNGSWSHVTAHRWLSSVHCHGAASVPRN